MFCFVHYAYAGSRSVGNINDCFPYSEDDARVLTDVFHACLWGFIGFHNSHGILFVFFPPDLYYVPTAPLLPRSLSRNRYSLSGRDDLG